MVFDVMDFVRMLICTFNVQVPYIATTKSLNPLLLLFSLLGTRRPPRKFDLGV